jgi:hypothetical protein
VFARESSTLDELHTARDSVGARTLLLGMIARLPDSSGDRQSPPAAQQDGSPPPPPPPPHTSTRRLPPAVEARLAALPPGSVSDALLWRAVRLYTCLARDGGDAPVEEVQEILRAALWLAEVAKIRAPQNAKVHLWCVRRGEGGAGRVAAAAFPSLSRSLSLTLSLPFLWCVMAGLFPGT